MCSQTFVLRLRVPQDMTQEEAVELLGVADCTNVLVGVGEGIAGATIDGCARRLQRATSRGVSR